MVSADVAVSISQASCWQLLAVDKPGDTGIKQEKNKKSVVLIEPDVSVRHALTVLLEGEGWDVDCLSGCRDLKAAIGQSDIIGKKGTL